MRFPIFELERVQSLYENTVEYNLTESGFHPLTLEELLTPKQIQELTKTVLGYGQTNGSIEVRQRIAALYREQTIDNVLVTNGSSEANFVACHTLLEPGDEGAVDLQDVDGEPVEVAEGGMAGAEVVEGQLHTHVTELLEQPDGVVDVAHHHALGDLERQGARRQVAVGHGLGHDIDQVGVGQLSAREIDGDPHRVVEGVPPLPIGRLGDGFAQHRGGFVGDCDLGNDSFRRFDAKQPM